MSHLPARRLHAARDGFTLIEMLIAMVLTLIMVAAIAEFYAYVGDVVKDGRAMIEMGGQLRAAVQRLKSDLDQLTSSVVPWADDGSAQGYFEYFEGPGNDWDSNGNGIIDKILAEDSDSNGVNDLEQLGATDLIGDADDYLAFTIRSNGAPFTGRQYTGGNPPYRIVSSQLAEVAWFTGFSDLNNNGTWEFNEPRTIHRRLLLIIPGATLSKPTTYNPPDVPPPNDNYFHHNDISMHFVTGNPTPIANSLADLTRRENRFAHQPGSNNFPNALLLRPGYPNSPGYPNYAMTLATYTLQTDVLGEDVVLSNVLAFDVQAYDPYARIWPDSTTNPIVGLVPSDVGYGQAATNAYLVNPPPMLGVGAYVDLGYYRYLPSGAIDPPAAAAVAPLPYYAYYSLPYIGPPGSQVSYNKQLSVTYDTWSLSYERDGIDQFSDTRYDLSTNGVDDPDASGNYVGGVDDSGERETIPPYPQPLRGLQVKIRLYEPSSRQVRQATVTADFLTE